MGASVPPPFRSSCIHLFPECKKSSKDFRSIFTRFLYTYIHFDATSNVNHLFIMSRKSALLSITLLPAVHPGQSQYSIPFARSASSCARIPAATSSPRCFTKSFSSLVMVEKLLILILWLTCQINTQSPENICIHRRQDNRAMRITIL